MKKRIKKIFTHKRTKHDGHPRDEPPEPTFLFAVDEEPCSLCGDGVATKARQEQSGVIWICRDALSCLRRQNFRVVE